MKLRILFVVMVVFVAGCTSIQTKEQCPRASAEQLLEVLRMGENFDNAMQQATGMQKNMLSQMDLSEEEMAAAQKAAQSSMKVTMEKFSWANMKEMFVDIYAEVFTVEELNDIIAFYESPQGQKFVEKQPELTRVTMQKMQAVMAEVMPEIQKETAKMVEQLKAEREVSTVE